MTEIIDGWRFFSADFSLNASGKHPKGRVTLIRDPEARKRWHDLPEEVKESDDCPELYIQGEGITLNDAIADANANAFVAKLV